MPKQREITKRYNIIFMKFFGFCEDQFASSFSPFDRESVVLQRSLSCGITIESDSIESVRGLDG